MVDLSLMRKMVRKAVEALYDGKCTVTELVAEKDDRTKLTRKTERVVLKDVPCRLSFERSPAAEQTETAAQAEQTVKLFIAPEAEIKAGSRVTATQCGVTTEYAASGPRAVYATHQEISLELFRGWT